MPQSLCKIYIHIVFHIKNTSPTIYHEHLSRLHPYIGEIINKTGCKSITVGGTENHVHALVILSRTENISHLVEEIKRNSSRWMKTLSNRYETFSWQRGYGAFSVSQSVVDKTIHYIQNQLEHHKSVDFKSEYLEFLKMYQIDFDDRYIFED